MPDLFTLRLVVSLPALSKACGEQSRTVEVPNHWRRIYYAGYFLMLICSWGGFIVNLTGIAALRPGCSFCIVLVRFLPAAGGVAKWK